MTPSNYGPSYQDHLLEQYKLYVEMADRVSQRRAMANNFFLALNTGLLTVGVSLAGLSASRLLFIIASIAITIFGFFFAIAWARVLKSYRELNTGKYQVIHELEALLPRAPYDEEWGKLGRGQDEKLYKPLTEVESWVPNLFMFGYWAAEVPLVIWYAVEATG